MSKELIKTVKDELAKKYGRTNLFLEELIGEAMELYHSRKFEEAGKELPDDKKIESEMMAYPDKHSMWAFKEGMDLMKQESSKLLASKQSQLDEKEKDLSACKERLEIVEQSREEQLQAKDKEIDVLETRLMRHVMELQKAKADVERLKGADNCPYKILHR